MIRSPLRRMLNRAWLTLLAIFAAEVGWFVGSRALDEWRTNANLGRIQYTTRIRAGMSGRVAYQLDGARVKYAVFEYPEPTNRMSFYSRVGLSHPYSAGQIWLNVSRTERVQVNTPPPKVFVLRDGRVTITPLPAGFTDDDLKAFVASPEFFTNVPRTRRSAAR